MKVGFDPEADIPGYATLRGRLDTAVEIRDRAAVFIAVRAAGLTVMNDLGRERYEGDLAKYRRLHHEVERARGILDQCYEAYAGDWEY